jgi:hypothetical protein
MTDCWLVLITRSWHLYEQVDSVHTDGRTPRLSLAFLTAHNILHVKVHVHVPFITLTTLWLAISILLSQFLYYYLNFYIIISISILLSHTLILINKAADLYRFLVLIFSLSKKTTKKLSSLQTESQIHSRHLDNKPGVALSLTKRRQ